MPRAPIDDIFEYLRHCEGKDDLVFPSIQSAHAARQALIDQLDSQGVDLLDQPEFLVFETTLSIRLRKDRTHEEPPRQVPAVSRCG